MNKNEVENLHPKKIKKTKFAGKGAALQLLGVLAVPIGGVLLGGLGVGLGAIAAVCLFVAGSKASTVWHCEACGIVTKPDVWECPGCHRLFRRPS